VSSVIADVKNEMEMLRGEPKKANQLKELEGMVAKMEAKQAFEQRILDIDGKGQAIAEEEPLSPKRDAFMQSIKEMYESVMAGEFPPDGVSSVIADVKNEMEMLRGEPKKANQLKELEGMVAEMEAYNASHGAPAPGTIATEAAPAATDEAAEMKASIAANVAKRAAQRAPAAASEQAPTATDAAAEMQKTIAANVAQRAAEAEQADGAVQKGDDDDDSDSGSDEEDEADDDEVVDEVVEEINPNWKVYRNGKFKAVSKLLPTGKKVRVYSKRMVLKAINELNKLKAKADKADDREKSARATMQEMVDQMMTQKYGVGVYKARKQLSFLKSVHAFAKPGGKEDVPEALLLSKGLEMGSVIENEKIIKISDTYSSERKDIIKDNQKAVFIKADRVDNVLEALRPEGGNKDSELAAAAALPKQDVDGAACVSWPQLVLISSLTAKY